jgi:hypothetical protein
LLLCCDHQWAHFGLISVVTENWANSVGSSAKDDISSEFDPADHGERSNLALGIKHHYARFETSLGIDIFE